MNTSCSKRLARPTDFESVYRVCMHPSVIPFLSFEPMPANDFKSIFAGLLASERFFVFARSDEIGGFAHVSRHPGRSQHTAFISTLAVDPHLHATGFAHAMMQKILGDLRSESARRVELVVEADNPRAIRFYKRHGLCIEGTMRRCYRRAHEDRDIDSHIMAVLFPEELVANSAGVGSDVLLVR